MNPDHYRHNAIGDSFVWCEWKGDVGKLENNRCEHCKLLLIRIHDEHPSMANNSSQHSSDNDSTSDNGNAGNSVAGHEPSTKAQGRPDRLNPGTG